MLGARPRAAPQGSRGHDFLAYDRTTARPLSAALFGPSVCRAQPGASPGEARAAQHAASCWRKAHTPSRMPPEHESSCTGTPSAPSSVGGQQLHTAHKICWPLDWQTRARLSPL